MAWWLLFKNEVKLQAFEMRQYWFETLAGLIAVCGIFIALFYGIKSFAFEGEQVQSLDGLVFGFLLWSFASAAYMSVTKCVVEDTQKGYIEQLFINPKGFTSILFVKAIVELISALLFMTLIAHLTMWLTGNWIDINFPLFFVALLMAAPSLIGLGLLVSGVALVYKKVDTIAQMLTLGLMALVALEGLPFGPVSFLPFTPGVSIAKDWVLNDGPINTTDILIVLGNSALYMLIGSAVFKHFERVAKRKNLVGQY